jgi:diadenylate cyclase
MDLVNSAATILKSVRIQDVLDMAIIAAMIFALLTWFKTRASRFVLMGIILLGGVYIAARFFQLYLTIIVLQSFFAIFLFVLVVIFQEDLRGFFAKLAMLGNIRKKSLPLSKLEKTAKIIAQTADDLAKKRVGALICLQGSDHLGRHLSGGTMLDGLVSEPLLESIFDPHSIGHDGAVIIRDDRVNMFGCHLPLSTNIAQHGPIGLRHTAALGLAERSDALCIVVSEERGTISIAQEESLTVIANTAALQEVLEQFYIRNTPAHKYSPGFRWLKENTWEKIIALGLACILWVAFGYQRDIIRRDFLIPIEYKNIPQNWKIDEPQVTEVKVIFQGPQQAFRLLNERSLALSLDLAAIRDKKREYVLTKEMDNAPSNLLITEISPAKIRIYASRQIAATVPISVITTNSVPADLYLQRISVTPASTHVMMDSRMDAAQVKLKTEPIDLSKISSSTRMEVGVVPAAGVTFADGKIPTVRVFIRVKKKF